MSSNFDIVKTDEGFSMLIEGQLIPVPIGFMRISEAIKLAEFMKEVFAKVHQNNNAVVVKLADTLP